jgi:hypothetical protein
MSTAAARAAEVTDAFRTIRLLRTGQVVVKEKRSAESISYATTAYRVRRVQKAIPTGDSDPTLSPATGTGR